MPTEGRSRRAPTPAPRRPAPTGAARRIAAMRAAAQSCTACPLYLRATQAVFGEGAPRAALMLVGEQPGDVEDREGHPFVGPAGRLLDAALAEAGIERRRVYLTNAVKHFKWEPRGKRRLHKTPAQREVEACRRQWLDRELETVRPKLVVCLGATAAKALLGSAFRISVERGRIRRHEGLPAVLATFHPSYLLRLKGRPGGEEAYRAFVDDLRAAARHVQDDSDT